MKLDFTNAKVNPLRMYGGANGNKIGIIYRGENYMLKFPPKPTLNKIISHTNSCISEYVACHICAALGMDTQETLLGLYGNKLTVACKDFEVNGFILKDFAHLKNTVIDSEQNGYGTEIGDILSAIEEQQIVSSEKLKKFFGEMFIVDALLGNFDRHNGNWGFLVNEGTREVKISPVFDCGSCLYPQMDEARMDYVLNNTTEIEERIFVYPTSALQQDGKKINYAQFLRQTKNIECLRALAAIGKKVDLLKINAVIDATPYISETYKRFLKVMVKERKEKILDIAMERTNHLNRQDIQHKELER